LNPRVQLVTVEDLDCIALASLTHTLRYLPKHDTKNRPIGRSNSYVKKQPSDIPWIWEGVLVEGAVTLLSAPEKIGKTTLLSLLLDRRRAGGQLLGRAVYPGKTVLASEEDQRLWTLRQPPLDFGSELTFHRPVGGCPTRGRWKRFIDDLYNLSDPDDHFDLLVIDTAVNFLPLAQRNARVARWALSQLRMVANMPAAVLIVNQSRNVHRPLAAFADIVIEMAIPRGLGTTRRRTFTGVGRYPDTLASATAELNLEGTDYILQPDSLPPPPSLLATLQALLTDSATPLTCQDLIARWPGDPPRHDSLWRTLERAVDRGLFAVEAGSGTKNDAYRYGIANQTKPADQTAGQERTQPVSA